MEYLLIRFVRVHTTVNEIYIYIVPCMYLLCPYHKTNLVVDTIIGNRS
jgi:hypothetical protein